MLSGTIFDSRIKSESVTSKEKVLGYFLGPVSVSLMVSILNTYLNVYYTDVLQLGTLWGGTFLSLFPVISKILGAVFFLFMGRIVDQTNSPQGKARPWILISAPVLLSGMVLLFFVPQGGTWAQAAWIFISYNLFYSIGYTAYATAHTLLVPLATRREKERNVLSLATNALNMVSGTFLTILFPCFLLPMMGVNRTSWMAVMLAVTVCCAPLLYMEYYYTVERVTLEKGTNILAAEKKKQALLSVKKQFLYCVKSRQWIILMIYMLVLNLFNNLSSYSTLYYCNWVLGNYNDGITQALFFGIGNAPLGLGIFLCKPVCDKFGRKNAMMYGYLLAAAGCLICYMNPQSLAWVLIGQAIKAVGLIPSTFMVSTLLADALDEVEEKTTIRCDGFSSSVFNVIGTLAQGAALGIFNFFLMRLQYLAPTANGCIPTQNAGIEKFFSFGALGAPLVCYVILFVLLYVSEKKTKKNDFCRNF